MKKVVSILLGVVISANAHATLMTKVADNAYITVGGYDIAWAAPVSQVPGSIWLPVDYSYQSQFGWAPITKAVYDSIGGLDAIDFTGIGYNAVCNGSNCVDPVTGANSYYNPGVRSIAIATAWFSNEHLHIDYTQAIGGNAWSGLDFEGSSCPGSCNESLAYRVHQAEHVPEPATLALLSLGLAGIVFSRKNKSA